MKDGLVFGSSGLPSEAPSSCGSKSPAEPICGVAALVRGALGVEDGALEPGRGGWGKATASAPQPQAYPPWAAVVVHPVLGRCLGSQGWLVLIPVWAGRGQVYSRLRFPVGQVILDGCQPGAQALPPGSLAHAKERPGLDLCCLENLSVS